MATSKKKLYERYLSRIKPLLSSPLHAEMADALYKGKTKVLRMSRYESSAFDTSWVEVIEDVLYDLGEIIKVPRTITKELGSLTPIELAKKVTAESVQHLASHTQYVKTIDEEGNITPSKVLSFSNDDFLYTYENRFIATFIRRLVLFIEKRYEFIQAYIPLHKEEVLMVKTKAVIEGAEVEIETRIKSKAECTDPDAKTAEMVAERIRRMREYILYYYASPFMKKMKNERDVRKPILMTNILRKNVRYHKCYEVFSFIERYDSLGMNYKSDDTYSSFSDEQLQDMALLNVGQFLALQDDSEYETIRTKPHSYKPRILSSIDDEEFLFGPIVKGPIQFVRVDEEYRKYLDERVPKDLPEHPRKAEKSYYEDEYALKKETKEEQKQIDKLLHRKQIAVARFEHALEKIISLREYEDNLLLRWEFQERLDTEEMLLNKKRSEIAAAGLGYRPEEATLDELLARAKKEVQQQEEAHRDYYASPDEEELEFLREQEELERIAKKAEEEKNTPVDEDEGFERREEEKKAPIVEPEEAEEPEEEEEEGEDFVTQVPAKESVSLGHHKDADEAEEPEEEAPQEEPEEEKPEPEPEPEEEPEPEPEAEPETEEEIEEPAEPEKEAVEPEVINEEPEEEEAVEVAPVVTSPAKKGPAKKQPFIVVKGNGYDDDYSPDYDRPIEDIVMDEMLGASPLVAKKAAKKPAPQLAPASTPKPAPVPKAAPKPTPAKRPEPMEMPKEDFAVLTADEMLGASPKPKKPSKPVAAPQKKAEPKPEPKPKDDKKTAFEVMNEMLLSHPADSLPAPGSFVVKTEEGYFVSEGQYVKSKSSAKVFHDYHEANAIKNLVGGKVVKL